MGLVESRDRKVNVAKGYRVVDMGFESHKGERLLSFPDPL